MISKLLINCGGRLLEDVGFERVQGEVGEVGTGEHPFERYREEWVFRDHTDDPIYINYHYAGDVEWETPFRRRRLEFGDRLVLVTDGLRTKLDFNHSVGMNVLSGDGSVAWREDGGSTVYNRLPDDSINTVQETAVYQQLWSVIEAAPPGTGT